ncbi:MAG: DUF1571 domain-containing protein [Bacteroidetes bacterium]|nr:DUF1571 domain-containing protein [Bacteroidota bacterium]
MIYKKKQIYPNGLFRSCLLFTVLCLVFLSFTYRTSHITTSSVLSCKEILQNTIASVEKIQTLKFHLKCNERFKGKIISTESQIKLNTSPRKMYIYLRGPELLWVKGKNNGNALINPNGFPYMNLSLDPMGSLMREKQHHTINEAGFDYFADIIKSSINITGEKFDTYFKCVGTMTWDEHECYFIVAEYSNFKYVDYTVQKGETLVTIGRKLKVSDYMLLEINADKVSNYHDVKPNQKIKVPNVYGSKMILYIDKELLVPRIIKVYDDKGLFESYEYHDLQVNAKISEEEFTKDYKGYGF